MIEQLSITNLGVISQADLRFSPGFTALTGETGAGKTMVLSSIELLLGQKSNPNLVRYGETELAVEGIFTSALASTPAQTVIEAGGIVEEDEIILARTVRAKGRSRSHAGGRTVPSAILSKIGAELVTIHGQAEQLNLRTGSRQLALLDSYGQDGHRELLKQFREKYHSWQQLKADLEQWENQQQAREMEVSRLREGIGLQEKLQPYLGEEDELLRIIERLGNIEELREAAGRAYSYLSGSDGDGKDAASLVGAAVQALERGGQSDEELLQFAQGIRDASAIIMDISAEVGAYLSDLEADPGELDSSQSRLSQLRNAYRPYAKDLDSWLSWAEMARQKLTELSGPNNQGTRLREELEKTGSELQTLGSKLTRNRQRLAKELQEKVAAELGGLQMQNAGFEILVESSPNPSINGYEQVIFGLRQAKGAPVRPVSQGASGGELSRIMLALEVSLATRCLSQDTPTFIFDEVDAGIGGQTALAVGERLARLAQHTQVIVVTHLPQVAAWADKQLVVTKTGNQAGVREVTGEEREVEIARMLAGKAQSKSALDHARELISSCRLG